MNMQIKIDYKEIAKNQSDNSIDEFEEKRLDELDKIFPKIMALKAQEDSLLGVPVTKYDASKSDYYTLYPNGEKVYGKEIRN